MSSDDKIETSSGTWTDYFEELFRDVLIYAAKNPFQFIYYVLLCLSPLFAISAYLSWKLAKAIEQEKKQEKRKQKREAQILAKSKQQKKNE